MKDLIRTLGFLFRKLAAMLRGSRATVPSHGGQRDPSASGGNMRGARSEPARPADVPAYGLPEQPAAETRVGGPSPQDAATGSEPGAVQPSATAEAPASEPAEPQCAADVPAVPKDAKTPGKQPPSPERCPEQAPSAEEAKAAEEVALPAGSATDGEAAHTIEEELPLVAKGDEEPTQSGSDGAAADKIPEDREPTEPAPRAQAAAGDGQECAPLEPTDAGAQEEPQLAVDEAAQEPVAGPGPLASSRETPPTPPAAERTIPAGDRTTTSARPAKVTMQVEVFVASRLLGEQQEVFTREELYRKVHELFGDERPGLAGVIHSSRLVANRPINAPYIHNYLWLLDNGSLRCFDPAKDHPVRSRTRAPVEPSIREVPPEYAYLLRGSVDAPPGSGPGMAPSVGDGPILEQPQTLGGWERKLAGMWPDLVMVFQADLSPEDTRDMAGLIRSQVRAKGAGRAVRHMRQYAPRVLVACLTFLGVYEYRNGSYWGPACRALGLRRTGLATSDWGAQYVDACRALGLATDVQPADAYVDVILFQGGMPRSCLPEFFENLLLPAVTRSDWSGMSDAALIATWLNGPARRALSAPVWRFLQFGGRVAEDVVAGLRQEAARGQQGAPDDEPPAAGLPSYMARAYREWLASAWSQSTEGGPCPGEEAPRERLATPTVTYAPWDGSVQVRLPEQRVRAVAPGVDASWVVVRDGERVVIPVRARREGPVIVTAADTWPLPGPTGHCEITLQVLGRPVRSWSQMRLDASAGILVFDPVSGQLAAEPEAIAGPLWWVLCPPGTSLTAEPDDSGYLRETFPEPYDDWHGWAGSELDVSGLTALTVQDSSHQERTFVPMRGSAPEEPRLVGGTPLWNARERTNVYIGAPPRVFIPTLPGPAQPQVLGRWQLSLRRANDPTEASRRVSLRDVSSCVHWSDNGFEVRLDDEPLLGRNPFGSYVLSCITAGSEHTFRFAVIPFLHVGGLDDLLLPPKDRSPEPATVTMSVDPVTLMTPETKDGGSIAMRSERATGTHQYVLTIPPGVSDLVLRLTRDGPEYGCEVRVPVVVPWVRWYLTRLDRPGVSPWACTPLRVSVDALEQSNSPTLVVDLPGVHGAAPAGLTLLDTEGDLLQGLCAQRSSEEQRCRQFDLRSALDTLREAVDEETTLEWRLRTRTGGRDVDVPVARITRHPVLEALDLKREAIDGGVCLTARWQPDEPLKRRELRLWSRTRPWEDPLRLAVPDEAAGEGRWTFPRETLAPALYTAELVAADPWSAAGAPRRPAEGAPHTLSVPCGNVHERLAELEARVAADTAMYAEVAECAFLRDELTPSQGIRPLFDWCLRHAGDASAAELLAVTKRFPEAGGVQHLASRLYAVSRIREVEDACRRGDWDSDMLVSYLRLRPSLRELSPDALEALLEIDDREVQAAAARKLVKLRRPAGCMAVTGWLADGSIQETDAVALLAASPLWAMDTLVAQPATPALDKLIHCLGLACPEAIRILRVGYWVRCRAGWGRIEQITGERGLILGNVDVNRSTGGLLLRLCIRPSVDDLAAVIDLSARTVRVEGDLTTLYECPKCSHFISADAERVRLVHNRRAHQGSAVGFRRLTRCGSLSQRDGLRFSATMPPDIWL